MKQTFWNRYRWLVVAITLALLAAALLLPSPSTSLGAFAYELIRRCPDLNRNTPASAFLVIGHRGAAGHAIENTLPSLDEAMRLGANAVEIDLCMTSDSAIVLWHDWMPDDPIATARQQGTEIDVLCKPLVPEDDTRFHRPTHLLTLAELREHYGYALVDSTRRLDAHIPTLEEALAWAAGASELKALYLDIKVPDDSAALGPAMIARIEKILAAARPSCDVVYLIAAENVYNSVEAMLPKGNVSFDREPPPGLVLDPCVNGSVRHALANGNRYASMIIPITSTFGPWTTVRRIAQCDVEQSKGRVQFVIGTTNDPDKLSCLLGIGVHGVFTDFPERVRKLVGVN